MSILQTPRRLIGWPPDIDCRFGGFLGEDRCMGNTFRHALLRFAQITLGCALYALGFCWFYAPNQMCMGGFTGLAQVIGLFIPDDAFTFSPDAF